MNHRTAATALCIASIALAAPVFANDHDDHNDRNRGRRCESVFGRILEVQIATLTGEPRVLGPVSGSIKGGNSSALKVETIHPAPGGALEADTVDTFVTNEGAMLVANGHALFTPIPGAPPGEVTDQLILTVDGAQSTGEFAGKTGTIHVVGVGHQFPPNPLFGGPGKTSFELFYAGQICRP